MKLIALLILLAGLSTAVMADGNPCSPGACKPRPPTVKQLK